MRSANKSTKISNDEGSGTVMRNLYLVTDDHQKLISSCNW